MKFLEIGKDTYINVDRIDGIAVEDINKVKVYVGGSDTPWVVDKSYENKFFEWIHGEGSDKE